MTDVTDRPTDRPTDRCCAAPRGDSPMRLLDEVAPSHGPLAWPNVDTGAVSPSLSGGSHDASNDDTYGRSFDMGVSFKA